MVYRKKNIKGDHRGRPRLAESTEVLFVRVSGEDKERLRQAAGERGVTIARFVRDLIVHALEKLGR